MPDRPVATFRGRTTREVAVVLVAAALLSALFTFPWAPNRTSVPTTYRGSGEFYAEVDASMWTYMLAWGASRPLRFYDAPVLLPVANPLCANDPRLTEGIWTIPLFRTLPPVLAWGVSLWLALALTAAACWYAGTILTGSRWGGAAVAVLFSFGTFRANHVCHIEGIFAPFLALALAAMARFLEEPGRRAAILFALSLTAATVEYSYVAVALAMTVPVAFVWGVRRRGIPWKRGLAPLALAAVPTAVVLAPVALRYLEFHRAYGVKRPISQIHLRSADLYAWITGPTGRVLPPFGGEGSEFFDSHLFPGFVLLALAAYGMTRLWKRSPELVVVGALAFLLSFGSMRLLFPQLGLPSPGFRTPYELLHSLLLPLQAIRTPARFGVLTHLVLAFAGAMAVARIAATARGRAAGAALLALAFLEARAGMHAVTILPDRAEDPAYRWLAAQPGEFAVLEAPMGLHSIREQHREEARSMLVALSHGRRTPNGTIAAEFPWHDSIAVGTATPGHDEARRLLQALGIRFVTTRDAATAKAYDDAGYRRAHQSPSGIVVFEVPSPLAVPTSPQEVARRLAGDPFHARSRSPRDGLAFRLTAPEEIVVPRGGRFDLPLTVLNDGRSPWAGDSRIYGGTDRRDGDVTVGIRRWRPADPGLPRAVTGPIGEVLTSMAGLPANVLPGESASVIVPCMAPTRPGRYLAEVDLGIRGDGMASPPDRPAAMVRVVVE